MQQKPLDRNRIDVFLIHIFDLTFVCWRCVQVDVHSIAVGLCREASLSVFRHGDAGD